LRLAREALEAGAAAPVVLNAANEVAVASFLAGQIGFPEIVALVQEALNGSSYDAPRSIGDVLEIDRVTRERTRAMMKASCS
jgi:1-deoxy-D-xylulose-5-phosphate reductoisomerase